MPVPRLVGQECRYPYLIDWEQRSYKKLLSNDKYWTLEDRIGQLNLLGMQQELLAGLALDGVADALDAARQALKDSLQSATFRQNEQA